MQLPELLKTHKGKTFKLVAVTNGRSYSVKHKDQEWKHEEKKGRIRYRLPRNYTPHHWKNFKRGCKLFLESHFPGFKRDQVVISDRPLLELSSIKTIQDDNKTAKNYRNQPNERSKEQKGVSYNQVLTP